MPQSIVPSTRKTLASLAYLVKDFQVIKRISKGRITKMDSLKNTKSSLDLYSQIFNLVK